ncbi:IclR family transcriptional regulator domain-containing protein [Streptomyces sp. NBC_01224]|uniref:IclR family transcriptional regulator domain-containing protein n=1 Tax=Streptomyces sp. NBC_01224 TaxID=2903783 RepID=UPI003FA34727
MDHALVRKRGFAINDQRTETGLTAVGMLIRNPVGEPEAGLSLAMPTARFDREMLTTLVVAMSTTTTRIENDLAAGSSSSSSSPTAPGSPTCPSDSGTDDTQTPSATPAQLSTNQEQPQANPQLALQKLFSHDLQHPSSQSPRHRYHSPLSNTCGCVTRIPLGRGAPPSRGIRVDAPRWKRPVRGSGW